MEKYMFSALTISAAVIAMYILVFLQLGLSESAVVYGIESLIIALATYFHLKHLVIPDVDYGVIRSIRKYNLLALIYAFLCMAEMLLFSVRFPVGSVVVCVLLCITLLIFVPVLERGYRIYLHRCISRPDAAADGEETPWRRDFYDHRHFLVPVCL